MIGHTSISVITPFYRQAHFLPEAVASVIAQSFGDWELIIVDDGSPDDTAAVAERLIAHYPQHAIRLICQANAGLSAARNNAIRVARGRYILPLDADDMIEPEMLEITAAVLDARPEIGFVYTDVRLFGADNSLLRHEAYTLKNLLLDCQFHVTTLFRREAWAQSPQFRPSMNCGYEDWDFWLSLVELGWQGYHIPLTLMHYRRTSASKLARDKPYDMEIRAQIVLNHTTLYPAGFLAWAWRVHIAAPLDTRGRRLAFLGYCALIGQHAPWMLPKALLRPLYWRLPERHQGKIRRIGRLLRLV